MIEANELLSKIETRMLWAFFHKDWLLQIRDLIRPQLPRQYAVFVASEAILVSPFTDQPSSVLPDLSVSRPEKSSARGTDRETTTQATVEVEESCELFTTHTLLINFLFWEIIVGIRDFGAARRRISLKMLLLGFLAVRADTAGSFSST